MAGFHWPGFDSTRKLSPEEVVELAARVAELTKAGLPLGGGLRALAGELPGRRLPHVLQSMADRLDAGADLAATIEAEGGGLPTCLRGLVLAGIQSGRLAEVLEEYVDLQRSQLELRRRVWLSLAYPLVLLTLMALMAVFVNAFMVQTFRKIFEDFRTKLPDLTLLILNGAGPAVWLIAILLLSFVGILLALRLGASASWVWAVLYRVPMLGPLLRWSNLARCSRLMALLLEQQVPLPDALRLTGVGLPDANLARSCDRVADDVEKGGSLGESMAAHPPFPASIIPMIQWGQRTAALPDAFRAAAEMFGGRVRSQGTLLEAILLPITLLAIITFAGIFIVAMMLPLISLIQNLSGA